MKNRYILYLLAFLNISSFTKLQGQAFPAPLRYQINNDRSIKGLPDLKWLVKEGQQALSPEDLNMGNIKDAEIKVLSENAQFEIASGQIFWSKIKLQSELELTNWRLSINMQGNADPFIQTFFFLQKIAVLKEQDLPADWKGVELMQNK